MKRLFAILMTIVMLFALLPVNTLVSAETVTKKPFYNINSKGLWSPLEYVYDKPLFHTKDFNPGEKPAVSSYGTSNVKTLAQKTKEAFDARPEGTRYINLNLMSRAVHCLVENNVYYDKAVDVTKEWMHEFFSEYKRIGGKLDGISLDVEYFYGGSWYIHLARLGRNPDDRHNDADIFRKIVEDPRYLTELRPMLEEYGFEFYPESKQTAAKSEIYSIETRYSVAYNVWNVVNDIRQSMVIDEAVYEPLKQYYPDAVVCDYQVGYINGWQKAVRDSSSPIGANYLGCGNMSNFNAYSVRPNASVYSGDYTTPASCYYAAYEQTAFNTCQWELNIIKNMYEATESKKISVHMTYFNYSPTKAGTYSNTPYYTENYFHTAMLDPKPLMSYVIETEVFANGQDFSDPKIEDYGHSMSVINDIMTELNRIMGTSDRKPIFVPATWNSKFILSGMYAGGRNVWRITPDTSTGVTLEEFKVKDRAPTFYINGQTITFPQGRIIEDGKVRQVGTCGYWIETPADVMPIITNDADRYSEYPSLLEDFEDYKPGSFKSAALPADCWEVSGNATVEDKDGNKVLSLSGSSTVKIVTLPKNITAGDSYAQQQAWEVAVTVPSSGELKLLTLSADELGVKLADGKVYYAQSGKYQELAGVTLTAGSTYTIKREFDFRTANGFKCTYTVYDASGNKLGGADNVAIPAFTLPAAQVGFASTNAAATQLDNIKLYPTGVTTELEAYHIKTGYKLDGLTSAKDAGYRLSWMNASDEYKVAKLYNNGTLLQEIKMAPGEDGVVTGVVKGSNIKLSVTTENGTAPAATNFDNGDFNWTSAVAVNLGLAIGKVPSGTTNPGVTPGPTEPDGTPSETYPDGTPNYTEPDGTPSETKPDGAPNPNVGNNSGNKPSGNVGKDKGADTTVLVLVIVLSVVLLLLIAFAVCYFIIKPKWLMNLLDGKKKQA